MFFLFNKNSIIIKHLNHRLVSKTTKLWTLILSGSINDIYLKMTKEKPCGFIDQKAFWILVKGRSWVTGNRIY
ncbi:hypothetical protein WQ54_17085 [Bacillus sp. SA1-12]|nr:hypothetical protein WQ54_17085 [Bacillus sp. SA1-12]